jgi:hypothetical protein
MTHAKKNPAWSSEVSKKSKTNSTNGKIIPFGAKAGKRGEQGQREKSIRPKKVYRQIQIPFPAEIIEDGDDGATGKLKGGHCRCPKGGACGIGLGNGLSANGPNEKRKKGIAAEDQRTDKKTQSPERVINEFLKGE